MTAPTEAHRAAVLAEAQATTTCPTCAATPGEVCTYRTAVRDDETGRFVRWQRVPRSPHQTRVAVATDSTWYGHALRQMQRDCPCGPNNMLAGRHPRATCPYHEVSR